MARKSNHLETYIMRGCTNQRAFARNVALSLLAIAVSGFAASDIRAGEPVPVVTRFTLDNGIRVAIAQVEGMRTFSAISYFARGLSADTSDHALWTRLVERMTTQPQGQSDGSTGLHDYRFETWYWTDDWRNVLEDHAKLRKGVDFKEQYLDIYREDVYAGALFAQEYKGWEHIAGALFAQAYRHGREKVFLEQEVARASVEELEEYRGMLLAHTPNEMLCLVGDIDIDKLRPAVVELFGGIKREGKPVQTVKALPTRAELSVASDLSQRYLVWAFPLDGRTPAERTALWVAVCLLKGEWNSDRGLVASIGKLEMWSNLQLPERNVFWCCVMMQEDASFEETESTLDYHIRDLYDPDIDPQWIARICESLESNFGWPEDVKADHGGGPTDVIVATETERASLWAERESYYGDEQESHARSLSQVKAKAVSAAVRKYLREENRISCRILSE